MTVGIDIRVLNRGTRTGVEEYTINLLSRLLRLGGDIEFKLFFNGYKKVKLDYDWAFLPNVKIYEYKIPNRLLFFSSKYFKFPKIDRLIGGADVFFAPHFFNAQMSKKCRKIVTFYDLVFEYLPDVSSWRRKFWQKGFLNIRQEAASAQKIISISQSTKQDLVDLYKINPEKISVIYPGVGEEFCKLKSIDPKLRAVKEKYNLPDKFILYLGTIEPRKNIIGLIKAFELLQEKNKDKNLYLVLAGAKGWLYEDIFKAARSSQIIFTGFIDPQDKVSLYNLASLFVYPSFFEGFGFPPLEAMACGLPVVTSSTSSLPEVVGNAALMVDPYNASELSWAMQEILEDKDLAGHFSKEGLRQAKMFSWDKCAAETLSLIKREFKR